MSTVAELAKLKRSISELASAISAKGPRVDADKRALKSEIEQCVQRLDELRNRI